MSNNPNYNKTSGPEIIRRRKKSGEKLAKLALATFLTISLAAGAGKLIANSGSIDYDKDGLDFSPNGGKPKTYFKLDEFSSMPDKNNPGHNRYEFDNGAKVAEIYFEKLENGGSLVVEEGGSFRTAPIAADIERKTTILLANQETKIDNLDEIGYYITDGDKFYIIDKDEAPADVQEYIDKKDIEPWVIDGEEKIFISMVDADLIEDDKK